VTDDVIELLRCREASEARAAARVLLAAGLDPQVRRDGDDHVVAVVGAQAEAAAGALGLTEPDIASPGAAEAGDLDEAGDTALAPEPAGDVPGDAVGHGTGDDADDDSIDIDGRGYAAIALARDDDEARLLGSRLLEHGIGFDIAEADDAGFANPMLPAGQARILRVVEDDAPRALALLGVEPPRRTHPEPAAVDTGSGPAVERRRPRPESREVREYFGGRLRLTQRQAVGFVVLYLLALVLVPLAFFYGVRYMLADDIEVEVPTIPTSEVP
jgi:hypothetical protein